MRKWVAATGRVSDSVFDVMEVTLRETFRRHLYVNYSCASLLVDFVCGQSLYALGLGPSCQSRTVSFDGSSTADRLRQVVDDVWTVDDCVLQWGQFGISFDGSSGAVVQENRWTARQHYCEIH